MTEVLLEEDKEGDALVVESLVAVAHAAKRQSHLSNKGVGLGPSGKHAPGECGLCDALRSAGA